MANKTKLLEVASALRCLPKGFTFDMTRVLYSQFGDICGCIAGVTIFKFGEVPELPIEGSNGRKYAMDGAYSQAKALLELNCDETDDLFFPLPPIELDKITAAIAADVVERFALTGEISWPDSVLGDEPEAEFARS